MFEPLILFESAFHSFSNFNLQGFILSPIYRQNSNVADSTDNFIQIMVIVGVGVMILSVLALGFGPPREWRGGRFPWMLRYRKKNLYYAYICLGWELIKKDRSNVKESAQFMSAYLDRRFKGVSYKSYHDVINIMKNKVSEYSVMNWLERKMPMNHRIQLIDFLIDLAFSNDSLTTGETRLILKIAKNLKVSKSEVESLIGIRIEAQKRRRNNRKQVRSIGKKERLLAILGLGKNAAFKEVKSRYRELVKKYHPDLFARMGKGEQEMAHERFVAINSAYDYLEQHLN